MTLPDNTVIEYVHDPLGRRIAKKVGGTVTEKYLWQGLTRLLAVYDGNDSLLMRFEYADARMPVAMTKGGVTYYLAYDQVGSLKVVANDAGSVIKRIEYDTFGNIISDSDPAFALPFGFAGGLHDSDTGLVRFGHRDYDPETGRWTAKDPILFAGGDTDLYGYCVNDPVNFTDPDGLFPCDPGAYSECEARCKAYGTSVECCDKILILGIVFCKCKEPENDPCPSDRISGPGKMQKDVERGRCPRDVDRVDPPHVEGQQPHVHYKDGTSSNADGTAHDKFKGQPNPSNKTKKWLEKHGWTPPQ